MKRLLSFSSIIILVFSYFVFFPPINPVKAVQGPPVSLCAAIGDPCGNVGDKTCCTVAGKNIQCVSNKCAETTAPAGTNPGTTFTTNDPAAPKDPPSPPCNSFNSAGGCLSTDTAFGSMVTDPALFISRVFGLLIGLAGGISLLLIILAGYKFMTSQGKPEAIQGARDQLIAAIVGLVFIIFSFVILEVIGVDILRIPGAKGTPGGGLPKTCAGVGGSCDVPGVCSSSGGTSAGGLDCGAGKVCCTFPNAPRVCAAGTCVADPTGNIQNLCAGGGGGGVWVTNGCPAGSGCCQ